MRCAGSPVWIVVVQGVLKTPGANAFKQSLAPSEDEVAGTGAVTAAAILKGFAEIYRSVKSFRCGQHRRCATCSPSLVPRCRIGRHQRYVGLADSGICARATRRFGGKRSLWSRAPGQPAGLGGGASRPSAGSGQIVGRWNRRHPCKASRERLVARQFQIAAGRVGRNGRLGARFVFVSSNPGLSERFLPLTPGNAVSCDCAMPYGAVDHGNRFSSSRGGVETSPPPSTVDHEISDHEQIHAESRAPPQGGAAVIGVVPGCYLFTLAVALLVVPLGPTSC